MFYLGVTGGRDYQHRVVVFDVLDDVLRRYPDLFLFVGDATGADALALEWAKSRGVKYKKFEAQWKKYGKAAGPIRNREFVPGVNLLVAFPGGRGTADATSVAEEFNIPVEKV